MTANKMPEMPEAAKIIYANRRNTASVRSGGELGGYVKERWYTADQMRAMWLAGIAYSDEIIERLRRDMQTINDDCDGDNHLNVSCDALDAIGAYRNNLSALEQGVGK